MKRRWRYALLVALTSAILAVLAAYFVAEWWTRSPPNYSRIEDGLYLGGRVAQPPPGTRAVLNLCETEDSYRAEVHRWQPIPDAEPAPSIDWLLEHQPEGMNLDRVKEFRRLLDRPER